MNEYQKRDQRDMLWTIALLTMASVILLIIVGLQTVNHEASALQCEPKPTPTVLIRGE